MEVGPNVLGIDIGGSKLLVGLLTADGQILARRTCPTPRDTTSKDVVWGALAGMVKDITSSTSSDLSLVGCACAGPLDFRRETVSPLHIPAWRDFPLVERLEELTGLPTTIDNDVKALALAEAWLGCARGQSNYLALVVSTGVGCGIVVDNHLLSGDTGNAGHIGHLNVSPSGRPCVCGSRGCLQAEASGSAIARITGASAADASAQVVDRTGKLIGQALASVVNLLDVPLIVIGGGVALGFGEPFFEAVRAEFELRARLRFSSIAKVVMSPLGPNGSLIGAAALALRTVIDIPGPASLSALELQGLRNHS